MGTRKHSARIFWLWVATALLGACGGDTAGNRQSTSDGGANTGGGGAGGESDASAGGASTGGTGEGGMGGENTGGVETGGVGVETGGMAGAGASGTDGSAGSTGAAGSGGAAGATSGPTTYRACRWETEPQAIVVSKWDHETCLCTRLKFEERSDCAFSVGTGAWCLQDATVTNDVADCEHRFSATGTQARDASGSVSIDMTEPWQLDVGVTLELPATQGSVAFEINDCWVSCERDCDTLESDPLPTSPSAVVRSYCGQYYEIEIFSPDGFYVGALDWVLDVGGVVLESYRFAIGGSTYSLIFRISVAEFDALVDGAPITAWYGNSGSGREVQLGILNKALVEAG